MTTIADELITRINNVASEIEVQAAENERLGCLSNRTLELLSEIGVRDALVPAEYGGLDLTLYDTVRVYEKRSQVDSSVGWVAIVPGVQGQALLMLDDAARDQLAVGSDPRVAGAGAPKG